MSLGASTSSSASAASYDSIASASRQCELRARSPSPAVEVEPLTAGSGTSDGLNDNRAVGVEDDADVEHEAVPDGDRSSGSALDVGIGASSPWTPRQVSVQKGDQLDNCATPIIHSLTPRVQSPTLPAPASPSDSFGVFSSMFPAIPTSAVSAPTFLDETFDLIAFTPLKPNAAGEPAEGSPAHVADASYESDMDSPMGRAPVMIPIFSVASPPKAATPMRALEPMQLDDLAAFDAGTDTAVALPLLDSPKAPRGFSPLVDLAPAANRSPSKLPVLSPVKLPQPDSARAQRILARKAATKEHLENLFSSKLGSPSRPAPSSVLGKSTTAAAMTAKPLNRTTETKLSASTAKVASKSTNPAQKAPAAPSTKSALKSSTTVPPKSILKSSKTSAGTKPRPGAQSVQQPARPAASKPSALPRPTSAVKPSHLPRPALKRPAATAPTASSLAKATAPSASGPASSKATAGRLFRMAPTIPATKPAGEPANTLKRSFAATQTVSRPTPAGPSGTSNSSTSHARPTLGMPSRLVRDPVSGATFFASSTSGSGAGGALFQPVLSPAKSQSPARPALGKPYRPTGMTPLASRTMPTPQRGGFPSASKAFKVCRPGVHRTTSLTVSWEHRLGQRRRHCGVRG